MTKDMLTMVLLAVVFLSGCSGKSATSESPSEALQAIIHLYENQDFEALIRDRYAEIGKAENEQQIQRLIDRFKNRYADEDKRNQAIELYRSLLSKSPEISGDGDVATYKMDKGFVKLSRMPNGKWGFHM